MNSEQKTKNSIFVERADTYAHQVYALSRELPPDERYGLTSQLRRAALSVPLNIIEGYARKTSKYFQQFLRIAYGSLKESQYLLRFVVEEKYFEEAEVKATFGLGDEIGAMLWKSLETLRQAK